MGSPQHVFTFHGIGEPPSDTPSEQIPYWVSREAFSDFAARCKGRDDIAITFDDGYLSDLREALPVLLANGLTARFAISVRLIAQRGHLDRLGIRELIASGMTVMSHGLEHRRWTELEPASLIRHLLESKRTLEDITETTIEEAVCPYGAYDARVLSTLWQSGYTRVFTNDGGLWDGSDAIVPRHTVHAGEDFETALALARSRHTGLRGMLKRVRNEARKWSTV